MRYKASIFFTVPLFLLFLNSCITNFVNSPSSLQSFSDFLQARESSSLHAVLNYPSEFVYEAIKRVFSVQRVSLVYFQRSHTRRSPFIHKPEGSYKTTEAGVVAGVVRKGKKFENTCVVYVYPKSLETEVNLYCNNQYDTLLPITNRNLLLSLERSLKLDEERVEFPRIRRYKLGYK